MTVTTAKDLVAQMKVGWNLGNTMDATGGSGLDAETSWGNVETTKLMIDQVKDAGFNVFRLPVSWGTHMDENYTVDEAWMNRVQEIVDYGIDNGMFVILNTHHEEWYMPKKDRADKDIEQLKALWKQICDRFQGYDEHLIFEGVNEPRLRGEGNECQYNYHKIKKRQNCHVPDYWNRTILSKRNQGRKLGLPDIQR